MGLPKTFGKKCEVCGKPIRGLAQRLNNRCYSCQYNTLQNMANSLMSKLPKEKQDKIKEWHKKHEKQNKPVTKEDIEKYKEEIKK